MAYYDKNKLLEKLNNTQFLFILSDSEDKTKISKLADDIRKSYVKIIENESAINAVDVVMCKDCKYNENGCCTRLLWHDLEFSRYKCMDMIVNTFDYCAWGEKI